MMVARSQLSQILDDECLTRGLADPEARILVEWLVEQADGFFQASECPETAGRELRKCCRRARAISRFVTLWCHQKERGAACQLAGAERFSWPLPAMAIDPCELMEEILDWENRQAA